MAWLLFLDESGQDRRESPYEVLAGIAIEDRQLWKLIQGLKSLQEKHFGIRLFDAYGQEAKAQKLLKRKVYKHAEQSDSIELPRRTELAKQAPQNSNISSNFMGVLWFGVDLMELRTGFTSLVWRTATRLLCCGVGPGR